MREATTTRKVDYFTSPAPCGGSSEVPAQANKDDQTRWQTKGIG